MFHLIGVAHRVQSKQNNAADSDSHKEFRSCVSRAIEQFKPVLVAEEFSDHALRKLSEDTGMQQESVTRAVAESFKVEHRFCDPDRAARAKMGYIEGTELALEIAMNNDEGLSNDEVNDRGFAIEVAKYWPLREQFWLGELDDVIDKDVIFICGDVHIESFQELLKRNGIDSGVLVRHIGVTQSEDEFWNRVTAYLEAHPELRD
jgi:hypothetical protein